MPVFGGRAKLDTSSNWPTARSTSFGRKSTRSLMDVVFFLMEYCTETIQGVNFSGILKNGIVYSLKLKISLKNVIKVTVFKFH